MRLGLIWVQGLEFTYALVIISNKKKPWKAHRKVYISEKWEINQRKLVNMKVKHNHENGHWL